MSMKLRVFFVALLTALIVCGQAPGGQAAGAVALRHSEGGGLTRIVVKNGPPSAKDFSPEGQPTREDTVEVPSGKTLEMTRPMTTRNLIVRPGGNIDRSSTITIYGDATVESPITWSGMLEAFGFLHLHTGSNTSSVDLEARPGSIVYLMEATTLGKFDWWGSFSTNGYPLHVLGLAYPFLGSSTNFLESRVEAGEYVTYPQEVVENGTDTWIFGMPTLVLRGQSYSEFRAESRCYKSILLEAGATMFYGGSSEAEELFDDNTPLLTIERGSITKIEAGEVVIGPAAQTIKSSEPGKAYTLQIPGNLEVASEATISDMHVEGGTLYDKGGHEGSGDSGIVFE